RQPADNCLACHMPRGDTDIPHIAFTRHRIGRPGSDAPRSAGGIPEPVPTDDVSRLSEADRQRILGLAYVGLAENTKYVQFAEAFRERGRELVEPPYAAGLLGRLYLELNQPRPALQAFQQAAALRPDRPDVQSGLAEAYRRLGREALAGEHQRKAEWLWQHRRE